MKITVRNYRRGDKAFLVHCMNGMQEHVSSIDAFKKTRPVAEFNGEKWVDNIFVKIKKYNGIIFIAQHDGKAIGCIVGIIKESTKVDLIDLFPFKDGRIIELYVDPFYRKAGVGSLLLRKIEQFFRDNGCGISELGVFAANTNAFKFYKKHGYVERNIDMGKKL